VFEQGFNRAVRQFALHHPSLDSSIFDKDKDEVDGKLVEDDV